MAGILVRQLSFPEGASFAVVVYDLLYEPVDCIVNPANGGLSHGGGVAAAIVKAAGPQLEDECDAIVREKGRIPVGEAVLTSAGKLPFRGVIHSVGPRMGDGNEEQKIVYCCAFKSVLTRMGQSGISRKPDCPGIG
jgi:O-acetyl-ADP-ribose deacetylase (regulator of RNase III)